MSRATLEPMTERLETVGALDSFEIEKGDEVYDGRVEPKDASLLSSHVALVLGGLIRVYCFEKNLGYVFGPDCGFVCFGPNGDQLRRPDASFIRSDRLTAEQMSAWGHCKIVPDLAVEVASPNDTLGKSNRKIREYLDAGVQLVWIVDPENRIVLILRADHTGNLLRESDELSGEDVVPGFKCRVAELFPSPGSAPDSPH